jgi:hypothetical protein
VQLLWRLNVETGQHIRRMKRVVPQKIHDHYRIFKQQQQQQIKEAAIIILLEANTYEMMKSEIKHV